MADLEFENQNGPDAISASKYKKLATEYAKLKAHVQVLKTALLEIRQEKDTLSTHLKTREQDIRKLTQEQESIQFVNGQLTRRVEILKSSLEQAKAEKKKKSGSVSVAVEDSTAVLEDELRSKIRENEELHTRIETIELEHQKTLSDLNDKLRIYQSKNDSQLKQEATEILETRVVIDNLRNENDSLKFRIKELESAATETLKSRSTFNGDAVHIEKQHQNGLVADSIESLSNCSSKSFSESFISTTFQESISDESPVVQPGFVVNPQDVFVSLGVFADQFLSGLSTWHGYECQMFSQSEYQGKLASDLASAHDNLSCELKQSIANFRDFTLTLSDGGEQRSSMEASEIPTGSNNGGNSVSCSFSSDSALSSFQAFLVSFLLYVSQLGHVLEEAGNLYGCDGEANSVAWINADLEAKNKQLAQCYSQLAISFKQFHICLRSFSIQSVQSHNSAGDAEMFISQLKQCLTTLKSDLRLLSKGVNQKITIEHQIEEVSEAAKTANECLFSAVHSLSRCTAKLCDVIRDNSMFFVNLMKTARTKTEPRFTEHQTQSSHSSLLHHKDLASTSAELLNSTITESSVIAENLRVIANSNSDGNNNAKTSLTHIGSGELSVEILLRSLMARKSDCQVVLSQLKQYAETLPWETGDATGTSGNLTGTSELEAAKTLNDELKRIERSLKESLAGCEDMEEVGLANFYRDEAETLHNRLCLSESMATQVSKERAKLREKLVLKQQELESTRESYQQQLSAMSEHVCELNEQLSIFRELQQASNIASSSSSNLNPLFSVNGSNNSASVSSNTAFITPSQVQFKPNYLSAAQNSNDSNGKNRHGPSPAFSISSNPLKSAGANIRNIFK